MLIKLPVSWLREYVDISVPIDELALKLHMSSTEVKAVERPWWDDKIRTARVEKLAKHPNADKLQLATVDYGAGAQKTVVTGATNLTEGAIVPYADEGATIIDGHTGERTILRGNDRLAPGAPKGLDVRIEDDRACPRFAAALLSGIEIGPSPAWMQARLVAAGMRPIDNVVDITNYVMLEVGQPLHAYDHRQLRGGALVARQVRRGESLRTLDGVDRVLPEGTLVIADAERALGVAGILGGEDSEIRTNTTTVALECASFEPRGIGRTATKLGLHGSSGSAAARRFSWELSPDLVPIALARACRLLREHAGAKIEGVVDRYPNPRRRVNVRMRFSDVPRVMGIDIDPAETLDILRRLQFTAAADGDTLVANPTTVSQSAARPTLRASLLDTARRNLRHRSSVAIFEVAPIYLPRRADLPEERWTIAMLLAGNAQPVKDGETWLVAERRFDARDLQGIVSGLAELLDVQVSGDGADAPGLHPGRSITFAEGPRTHLTLGQLDPRVAQMWELPVETFIAEIDLAAWRESSRPPRVVAPPRFPAALRDLAVVVEEAAPYADVEREIRAAAGKDLESLALLDLYRGQQTGEGKKSFAVRLVFRSASGTLGEGDVERLVKRITGRLQHALGATIRD
ncbi:MAG: phenylalanine--tRNA ligase subunit beta [Chloroflexi bacterium]|nr:MAG: phenylalanine--tRNA ligase subunit beta [Chloroflexota bacterium]